MKYGVSSSVEVKREVESFSNITLLKISVWQSGQIKLHEKIFIFFTIFT